MAIVLSVEPLSQRFCGINLDSTRSPTPADREKSPRPPWSSPPVTIAGLRIDLLLLSPSVSKRLKAAGVDRAARGWDKAAITPRPGSNLIETAGVGVPLQ